LTLDWTSIEEYDIPKCLRKLENAFAQIPGIEEYAVTTEARIQTIYTKIGLNAHFRNVREIFNMMRALEIIFNPDINNCMDFIFKRPETSQKNITFRDLMHYLEQKRVLKTQMFIEFLESVDICLGTTGNYDKVANFTGFDFSQDMLMDASKMYAPSDLIKHHINIDSYIDFKQLMVEYPDGKIDTDLQRYKLYQSVLKLNPEMRVCIKGNEPWAILIGKPVYIKTVTEFIARSFPLKSIFIFLGVHHITDKYTGYLLKMTVPTSTDVAKLINKFKI
jgi:hypothetical protein